MVPNRLERRSPGAIPRGVPRAIPLTSWERQPAGEGCFWDKATGWINSPRPGDVPCPFASIEEMGDYLEVGKTTIYRWIREGRLPPVGFINWLADQWDQDPRDVIDPTVPRTRRRTAFDVAVAELRRVPPDQFPKVIASLREPGILDALSAFGARSAARRASAAPR